MRLEYSGSSQLRSGWFYRESTAKGVYPGLCWGQEVGAVPVLPQLFPVPGFLAGVSVQLLTRGELSRGQAAGKCTHTAAATSPCTPHPTPPLIFPAAVQVQLEAAWLQLSSPPARSCTRTAVRQYGAGRSAGDVGAISSCLAPVQLLNAQPQHGHGMRQRLPAPKARSSGSTGEIQLAGHRLLTSGMVIEKHKTG